MAERKRGPVKPPVIDMKASDADKKAETSGTDGAKTAPPSRPSAKPLMPIGPWAAAGIGILGGAVLGVVLVLVLWFAGILPGTNELNDDLLARMIAAEESVSESLVGMRALNDRVVDLQQLGDQVTGLQSDIDALSGDVGDLSDRVAALESAPAPEAVDLTPIEDRVGQLSDRLEAIASGASSEDAGALADSLSSTRNELTALGERVSILAEDVDAREGALGSALAEIAALRAEVAAVPDASALNSDDLLRLPLILSSYESAVAEGRPFEAELAALGSILPDVTVPEVLTAAAGNGLPRGSEVAAAFSARVPEIMAVQPANPDAAWQEAALERLRALLAIRPAGEAGGNTPEAILSRLEAALARRDFIAAETLFGALPEPMQTAAGDVAVDIAALAAAETYAADLRAAALSLVAEAGN